MFDKFCLLYMETVSLKQCLIHQCAYESCGGLINMQILFRQFQAQDPTF